MVDTIFTFWEPRGEMPAYLELCKQTWEKNLSGYEIVVLDHSNLDRVLADDDLDLAALKTLPLAMQKDAIMVSVLRRAGGVFMDMDTIAVHDIAPLVQPLSRSELVMFDTHLAFVAARSNARVLSSWRQGIQRKLEALGPEGSTGSRLRWDYLGNSELARVMRTMLSSSGLPAFPARAFEQFLQAVERVTGGDSATGRTLYDLLDRAASRALKLTFARACRRYLTMLNRRHFIAESDYRRNPFSDPRRTYLDFWFRHEVELDDVFRRKRAIVGLHNSWTPQWYKELEHEAILSHRCLLSRTLNDVLMRAG